MTGKVQAHALSQHPIHAVTSCMCVFCLRYHTGFGQEQMQQLVMRTPMPRKTDLGSRPTGLLCHDLCVCDQLTGELLWLPALILPAEVNCGTSSSQAASMSTACDITVFIIPFWHVATARTWRRCQQPSERKHANVLQCVTGSKHVHLLQFAPGQQDRQLKALDESW